MEPAKIVLIEDNPGDVLLVEMALKEAGIVHELIRFETGVDAVRNLCGNGAGAARPDAILMDLNTPRSDGFEVLASLAAAPELKSVPIALLTSSGARDDKDRAKLYGARFIQKPSQMREFFSTLGNAVREMLAVGAER
jgi:CheY-like chemotaxis protein